MEENFSLYNGDCLDVLKTLEDNSIDSCVTDPPYGLSSVTPNNIEERIDKLFRKSFNVVFPDFNENDIGSFQYGKFFGVSIQSSDLSRFQIAPIIEPWIDMPKSSIDLDSNIEQGNKKIDTGTKSTTDIISDRILMDETNIMLGEFVGNYVFDFGDSVDFTRSDILCSFFSKYFPGKITVPISSIISPCLPDTLSDGNSFFGCKDLGYDIRSTNNSGSDTFSSGLILTRGGTKETAVLDFCFPTGSDGDIFSTVSTRDIGTFSQFLRPQIIRTFAATSSLSTMFESITVCFVVSSTDGTNHFYHFHLWIPKGFLKSLYSIYESRSGFMGKQWDYDVPPVEIWEQVFRVLKPGGHLLSFGGSRTYHRLVCRIEDAGFEIRDQIMWIHGQGFPKSHNISKQLDKANFANELAEEWDGWGTALKPAHEPICLARKPIVEKTVAKNVVEWGTGAINIDESRISLEANDKLQNAIEGRAGESIDTGITDTKWGFKAVDREAGLGRWPANIIHDSSEEVLRCFPNTKSGALTAEQQKGGGFAGTKNCYGTAKTGGSNEYNSNEGSAARFYYCAKASKSDRDEGLEKFLEKFQAGAEFRPNHMEKALQGETGNPYGRWDPRRNNHPTVKPTNLMKYLIKLVTQKGGIVLDPFMGSGTTGKACGFEDYKFVGIEMDKNYFEIAKARVEHAYRKETVGLEKFFK